MRLQWIVTEEDGRELLITYWESDDSYIEVAPRINHTRWGEPFKCRMIVEDEDER